MNIGEEMIQIQNRVTNYLSGAVIGDVTSAVDGIIARCIFLKALGIEQQIFFIAAFSEGKNMGVFTKQQIIACSLFRLRIFPVQDFLINRLLKQLLLIIPGGFIIHLSQVFENHFGFQCRASSLFKWVITFTSTGSTPRFSDRYNDSQSPTAIR